MMKFTLLLSQLLPLTFGFSLPIQTPRSASRGCSLELRTYYGDENMEEFEAARQAFEELHLMSGPHGGQLSSSSSIGFGKPLTEISKRFLAMEMQMIQDLQNCDAAIDPLVDFWVCEREDAAPILRAMEDSCSPGLVEEENELRNMIDYYRDEWPEPMSRLALLLFIKEHYEEAVIWLEEVLRIKPWHFEAGQLLVATHLRQRDFPAAIRTSRKYSLPPLNARTKNKRRKAWVERCLTHAENVLHQSEIADAAYKHDEHLDECPVVDGQTFCWE